MSKPKQSKKKQKKEQSHDLSNGQTVVNVEVHKPPSDTIEVLPSSQPNS